MFYGIFPVEVRFFLEKFRIPRQTPARGLVRASQGTGLAHAIHALLDPSRPVLQVMDFPEAPPQTCFGAFREIFGKNGYTLLGVIDHGGNQHARKQQLVFDAQVQPSIKNAIDHLLQLKTIVSSQPRLNPRPEFLPGTNSRALVITSMERAGNG